MNKKILSLILCLSLLMGLFTLSVSAAEGDRDNDVSFGQLGVSLTEIKVTSYPKKTEYREGTDELDLTGGVLTLYYSDNSTAPILLTSPDVNVTGFDNTQVGDQTIRVTYNGFEDSFVVKIVHIFKPATCDAPKTCTVCGTPEGSKLSHKSDAGTVTKAATCKTEGVKTYRCTLCGDVTKTEPIAKLTKHTYSAATCTKAATCKVCGVPSGKALGHKYTNNCDTSCNVCKATRKITHSYAPATCTKAATCKVCKATSGKALGHKYTNNCDTSCNVCKATRKITHTYKTTTTKATLKKNGSVVKKCTVCGDEASKTTIKYVKTIKLSATSYTYNGKVQKLSVIVKDSAGKTISSKNYTVSCSSKSPKNVGTYKVTIKMKGNYTGSKTLTFKINPPKTAVKSLTAGKKSLKVAITKKSTQVTGYEVQYSTSKKFTKATTKTKKVGSYKTTSYTIKSLSAKKTYYVRVRTYKKIGKTTYCSGWSTYKSKKTK